jgi:hypothetical protein
MIFPLLPPIVICLLEVEEKLHVLLAFGTFGKMLFDSCGLLEREVGIDIEEVEILQFRRGAFLGIGIIAGQRFFLLYAVGGHTNGL